MTRFGRYNTPKVRTCGRSLKRCRRCNRAGAHIKSYGLDLCRHCFREVAIHIGFKKYN
ncbi:30S ribosomal protein S14 [Candidatus Woesearchaeota archaeon]|nr:30S ribosomal protein S14 [Candidatus Woesearchaeota archaeon]